MYSFFIFMCYYATGDMLTKTTSQPQNKQVTVEAMQYVFYKYVVDGGWVKG